MSHLLSHHPYLVSFGIPINYAYCLTVPGSDYANKDSTTRLVFGRYDRKHCASIHIIDNEVLEDPEMFSVRLFRSGLNDYFTVSRQSTTVEITDDDGRFEMCV